MSGDHNTGWRKRQIALDIKAENARELGLNYEPSIIEREECAKLCEASPEPDGLDLADRIRARGQA